jgi:hypothetical protein
MWAVFLPLLLLLPLRLSVYGKDLGELSRIPLVSQVHELL